jgi:hypothetical protein
MVYFILGIVVLFLVVGLIASRYVDKAVANNPTKPFRIVENGLGEFVLQEYKEVVENMPPHSRYYTKKYRWEVVDKSADLSEMEKLYKVKMEEYERAEKEKEKMLKQLQDKEEYEKLEKQIVRVIK